jgi:uncharacterized protein YndB with AHSA1/START domain
MAEATEPAAAGSVHVERRIAMAAAHVWELLVDERAQQRWLGPGSRVPAAAGADAWLGHAGGPWASGVCESLEVGHALSVSYLRDGTPWVAAIAVETRDRATWVTVDVTAAPPAGSQPRAAAAAPSRAATAASERYWGGALERLWRLANAVERRRSTPRQAVVVIHGIGNQEPGRTLHHFVDGVFGPADGAAGPRYSKPDRLAKSFELRRVTVAAHGDVPTTDVYEMYWAHLVHDTTVSQVTAWASHLVMRRDVPRRFAVLRAVLIAAVVVVLLSLTAALLFDLPSWVPAVGGLLSTATLVGGALWRWLAKGFVVTSVGDAARYLAPRPVNIANRQAIREAGVDLLRGLHESGDYDRIVLVGHSLGSVIAYDMVRFYWIEVGQRRVPVTTVSSRAVAEAEKAIAGARRGDAQRLQSMVWDELRRNGQPWLVSDLVTVGSPLSMADFLMARDRADFDAAVAARDLPVCPPVTEDVAVGDAVHRRISFDTGGRTRDGSTQPKVTFLHHAAAFGATRWTNLHFPTRLVKGDPIGGAVAPLFGHWVRDVALPLPARKRRFLHGCYWDRLVPVAGQRSPAEELAAALRLDCSRELRTRLASLSPLLSLPPTG